MPKVPIRAAKPEVNAVLRRLRDLGLRLEPSSSSGHWRVIDPGTGAYLTSVSNTPSDVNWWHHIRRAVERAGFSWEGGKRKKAKRTGRNMVSAIDLEALAHAQRMARIHGSREPQLEDLEDARFLARLRKGFDQQETEEAISQMAPSVESARARRVVSRLLYMIEGREEEMTRRAKERNPRIREGGVIHELTHIAENVAKQRGLRYWKTPESAWQTMHNILSGTSEGMSVWVANLLEATMDEMEGLRWDVPIEPEGTTVTTRTRAIMVSKADAQRAVLDILTEEWQPRSEIHAALVPGVMADSAFGRACTELVRDNLVERQKQRNGTMLYRRLVGTLMPEPAEPLPAPESAPEPAPELGPEELPEPEFADIPKMPVGGTIADRYADVLLEALRTRMGKDIEDWRHMEPILKRLDALAGVQE